MKEIKMIMKSDFYERIPTKVAFYNIAISMWAIIRNTASAINKAVYRFPWVFIVLTVVVCMVASFVAIADARTERDSYNKKATELQLKYDSIYGSQR